MMNKNKASFLVVVFLLLTFRTYNQSQNPNVISNFVPVSPTAFQFLKYTEMPISEYTGLANISIPLYEINEDGVSVPIALTYHPIGNRVSQEASWVGLSWDMQFGSIVQMINDEDDFGTWFNSPYTKTLPDYYSSPFVHEFPRKFIYEIPNRPSNPSGTGSFPIFPPQDEYGAMITTDFYVPINGQYERQLKFFTVQHEDSEPDIFKANFLGHSINYILDWKTNNFKVLNKHGYKITKYNNTWKITVPTGDEYYFEEKSVVETNSGSTASLFSAAAGGSAYSPSSIIWMLTKIITKNQKQITFNYTRTAEFESFPNYSEKFQKPTHQQTGSAQNTSGWGPVFHSFDGVCKTYSHSKEQYLYVSSIVFPKGTINFHLSDRQDMIGANKLDRIDINAEKLIKSFAFNYSYFDSKDIGGYGFTPIEIHAYFAKTSFLRLKLLSLQENNGATHTFKYNETVLPKKNSFAQDLWGFYNGKLSNVSLIPNPSLLKIPDLPDNGNNNSANLFYAKASILEEIQYPTGGKVILDYSLNEFDNYWVPDFDDANNTISKGNGLRVISIRFQEKDQSKYKRTTYRYIGGKSIQPISMFRRYNISTSTLNSSGCGYSSAGYLINEVDARGFFSTCMFSSINGVGYDKVIKEEVDENEQSLGLIESSFYNTPDKIGVFANAAISQTLPACKNKSLPENGSVKSISYFDHQNKLLKKTENQYDVIASPIFYGAKVMNYTNLYLTIELMGSCWPENIYQNLISYYPIFDIETILKRTTETDIVNNNTLTTSTAYIYDGIHQISSSIKTTPTSTESTFFDYPYSISPQQPFHVALAQRNMLSVIGVRKERTVFTHPDDFTQTYHLSKEFTQLGDRILESKVIIREQAANSSDPKEIFYEYDNASGNLLKSTEDGITTGLIWDYKDNYVVAVVKGYYSSIAYSSFEADGKGGWTYSGIPVSEITAPTGKKIYRLNDGQIIKTGLIPSNTYILSYWSNSSPASININNSISSKTGQSINGWTYYEHEIVSASGNVIIGGYGNIDELRLYDKTAQMKTFTYEPLVGITSQCEVTNLISYYHYDLFGRLTDIKDSNGNIIKGYDYNLKGVPPNYNVFSNPRLEVVFTKNDCNPGFLGSNVSYVVPEGKYEGLTQSAADQLAANEVQKYGQVYANAQGRCDPIVYNNAAKSVIFIRNNCGSLAGSAVTYTVPAGRHSSIISQADADAKAQADVNANGQNYANQNGQCSGFYNVQKSGTFVRNNCTDIRSKGGTITYVVPARTIASTISQADADAKAQAEVNANGQNYANANGLCTTPPYISSSYVIGTTATLRCEPIDNCVSSKTEVRNIYGQLIATYPGGCGVEHIINVPAQGTQYKYTIIFYSNDYPSGITSTEVIMPYN